jgi:hypothetical protein
MTRGFDVDIDSGVGCERYPAWAVEGTHLHTTGRPWRRSRSACA